MSEHDCCETPATELAESRRRCWAGDCKRTARLEWCGWRYCLRHYWSHVLRDASTWRHKLVKLRFTEIPIIVLLSMSHG